MIYEFIATLAAGFGMAGIALIMTHLAKLAGFRAPKWLIPLFAAIGIFAFQIHQEYFWYDQEVAKLPAGVKVVKKIEDTAWFRPWSYFKPQTVRFMAVDVGQAQSHKTNPDIKLVNLYLFARRISVKRIPQLVDCASQARADYIYPQPDDSEDRNQDQNTASDLTAAPWSKMASDDPLLTAVCQ